MSDLWQYNCDSKIVGDSCMTYSEILAIVL
jgi:hypothetical protein